MHENVYKKIDFYVNVELKRKITLAFLCIRESEYTFQIKYSL